MAKFRLKSLIDQDSASLKFNPNLSCRPWQELTKHTNNCFACGLHKSRTQVVSGCGQQEADLLIIGEAPGQVEDEKGLAMVGDSGTLLNIMLDSVGLDSYYITNVIRCRPPGNRNPTLAECQSCWRFLQSEIALVREVQLNKHPIKV